MAVRGGFVGVRFWSDMVVFCWFTRGVYCRVSVFSFDIMWAFESGLVV